MPGPRTSTSDPLQIGWIVGRRVGLTIAPGKRGPSMLGPAWERSLDADLDRLVELGTETLVCLLEDRELVALGIPDLAAGARRRGIVVERLPIPDGGVPDDLERVRALIDIVADRQDRGQVVVIHCRGGLGRSGTIGGALLAALGKTPEQAIDALREARGPRCPETDAQRDFVRRFAASLAERPVRIPPRVDVASLAGLEPRASRFVATVLGAAIGDAMGHPTEFIRSLDEIRSKFGPRGVERFELWWEENGRRFAPYTDDTQMAEAVMRSLLLGLDAGVGIDGVMERMARHFVAWAIRPQGGHRGPGRACLAGCWALEQGVPWHSAGEDHAGGCGSVMRAYPFGLLFADDLDRAQTWAARHSRLTHGDPIALAACAAMAVGVARALHGDEPDAVVRTMAEAASLRSSRTGDMIMRARDEAADATPPEVTLGRLEGWAAHEAIAAAAYVFARHPDDARAAILEAANTVGDSDSIATLAGALVGARVGLSGLPADWVRDVERADVLAGLGLHAFQLTEQRQRE